MKKYNLFICMIVIAVFCLAPICAADANHDNCTADDTLLIDENTSKTIAVDDIQQNTAIDDTPEKTTQSLNNDTSESENTQIEHYEEIQIKSDTDTFYAGSPMEIQVISSIPLSGIVHADLYHDGKYIGKYNINLDDNGTSTFYLPSCNFPAGEYLVYLYSDSINPKFKSTTATFTVMPALEPKSQDNIVNVTNSAANIKNLNAGVAKISAIDMTKQRRAKISNAVETDNPKPQELEQLYVLGGKTFRADEPVEINIISSIRINTVVHVKLYYESTGEYLGTFDVTLTDGEGMFEYCRRNQPTGIYRMEVYSDSKNPRFRSGTSTYTITPAPPILDAELTIDIDKIIDSDKVAQVTVTSSIDASYIVYADLYHNGEYLTSYYIILDLDGRATFEINIPEYYIGNYRLDFYSQSTNPPCKPASVTFTVLAPFVPAIPNNAINVAANTQNIKANVAKINAIDMTKQLKAKINNAAEGKIQAGEHYEDLYAPDMMKFYDDMPVQIHITASVPVSAEVHCDFYHDDKLLKRINVKLNKDGQYLLEMNPNDLAKGLNILRISSDSSNPKFKTNIIAFSIKPASQRVFSPKVMISINQMRYTNEKSIPVRIVASEPVSTSVTVNLNQHYYFQEHSTTCYTSSYKLIESYHVILDEDGCGSLEINPSNLKEGRYMLTVNADDNPFDSNPNLLNSDKKVFFIVAPEYAPRAESK